MRQLLVLDTTSKNVGHFYIHILVTVLCVHTTFFFTSLQFTANSRFLYFCVGLLFEGGNCPIRPPRNTNSLICKKSPLFNWKTDKKALHKSSSMFIFYLYAILKQMHAPYNIQGPYIEIQTKDTRKHRTKRNAPNNCDDNERKSQCCRYPLRVDFRKFGWDWVIAPDIYEAYYCAGECPIGYQPRHAHTYISGLSSSFSSCCSPRKLSPLSLLYFDDNKQVIHSVIPNMAVEECGCSWDLNSVLQEQ